MTCPILYTNSCTLSQIGVDDNQDLWDIFKDNLFAKFLPELVQVFDSPESINTFIRTFCTYQEEKTGFLWGVRMKDKLIGFVAIMDIPDFATLFYAMHPDYRNRGIMSSVVTEVVSYWGRNYPTVQLYTEVYQENRASLSILQHHPCVKVILK